MDANTAAKRPEWEETKNGIRAIARFARPFKKELTVLTALGIISAIANGSVPYISGRFFDALIGLSQGRATAGMGSLPLWGSLLGLWALIMVIANNTDWILDRIRRRVDANVHFTIQSEGFSHLFRLPLSYHKNVHMNGELQKISNAGWRVSNIIYTVTNIAPQLLSLVIGITLAASINTTLAGVLIAGVIIYLILLIKIIFPAAGIDSAAHKSWNESWDDSAAAVMQIESVKQAAAEEHESRKVHDALFGKTRTLWEKMEMIWSDVNFFQRIIVFLTQLTIFLLSVRLVQNGSLTVGQLITLNGYAAMFFGPFVQLGYQWQTIQNGIIAAAHAEEIFRTAPEEYAPEGALKPAAFAGKVTFENASFSYGGKQPQVLENISFTANPGEIVALVGESGVGKSTTISLISGYNFPVNGRVLVDGIDTKNWDLLALRRHIAVVPQEVALFNDTIKANIRYGSFSATDEEVLRASREAHIDEFVRTFPGGYDTIVGERGVKLSVGQKQRVAIARAILRNPAILILDEPTSALDARTEKTVTEALERLMHGRTTFIIAHRLSTVRKANMIFVFEKGRIVEHGTHEELVHIKDGVYRHLYEYQIGLH